MDLTPQEQEEFEFHQRLEQEQSHGGFNTQKALSNVIPDLKQTAQGLGDLATGPALDIMSGDVGAAIPKLVSQGSQFLQNPKENLREMARPVTHPLQYAEEHPVQQAINVASLAAPMVAGPASTVAKYAGRFGENQMGKLHGSTPAMFRQLGREKFGPSMRASFEQGDADFSLGSIGRERAIKDRIASLGSDIGGIRSEAAKAGPQMSPQDMAAEIKRKALQDFVPGGKHFDEEGSFQKNLSNIESMPEGGIENFAKRASDIKHNASENKLRLPVNAETRVANEMSHINDAEIAKRLPEKQEQYEELKDQFGYAKNLEPMELRGEGKEALGASSNTMYGTAKNIAHQLIGGPKLGAKVGFGAEATLQGIADRDSSIGMGGLSRSLTSNPQTFGRYAAPLQKAFQEGGQQGLAAMHYVLSTTHPEYNAISQSTEEQNGQ